MRWKCLKLPMQKYNVLVITISSPILVGIYENEKLIDTIKSDGKTSDVLPIIFDKLLKKYTINEIGYVNGPGSFMAIKVGYIFLKTLSITLGIELKGYSAFEFNNNSLIKALGKKYFFKDEDGNIQLKFLENETIEDFKLPKILKNNIICSDSLPNYNLPAVN